METDNDVDDANKRRRKKDETILEQQHLLFGGGVKINPVWTFTSCFNAEQL